LVDWLVGWLVGWLEFNVPFQHKYGYIRDIIFLSVNKMMLTSLDEYFCATALNG